MNEVVDVMQDPALNHDIEDRNEDEYENEDEQMEFDDDRDEILEVDLDDQALNNRIIDIFDVDLTALALQL